MTSVLVYLLTYSLSTVRTQTLTPLFKHLRSYRDGGNWLVVIWPMCCHTGMSCCRHWTWHLTPSQYTDTGQTCRAIHWCGLLHWNTQLPILMSQVRPDREILPQPSTHSSVYTLNSMMLAWWSSARSSVESVLYPSSLELVMCESITLSAPPQLRPPGRIEPMQ